MFQHTAARRRLLINVVVRFEAKLFQHTAARRRLPKQIRHQNAYYLFQHTAARRRLLFSPVSFLTAPWFQHTAARRRLLKDLEIISLPDKFQHTAARRRLPTLNCFFVSFLGVSTHSRPKAAAVSSDCTTAFAKVSTHSRPKAAALCEVFVANINTSFNTQPPEGGCLSSRAVARRALSFQHTAARRRLRGHETAGFTTLSVSTHSRPKAAAFVNPTINKLKQVSTHSRPKAAAS